MWPVPDHSLVTGQFANMRMKFGRFRTDKIFIKIINPSQWVYKEDHYETRIGKEVVGAS
jgi:hypothetical protein